MKIDVYGREKQYKNWKENVKEYGIVGISDKNSKLILQYCDDMENGTNIARGNKKGSRSFATLDKNSGHMTTTIKKLESKGHKDLYKLKSEQINRYFTEEKNKGKEISTDVKIFKAFWHWFMKFNKKKGKIIEDITEELDSSPSRDPKFVYITKEDFLTKYLPYFTKDEQVILQFVYDSLIRSPTELMNMRAKYVYERDGDVWVNIPDEISKIKGRELNLLFSGEALKEYLNEKNLNPDDLLFNFSYDYLTWKMKKIAFQLWGDAVCHGKAGEQYKNVSLYDLRHSGAITLRLLAKENPNDISLDAIRERGGWKDFKMLNYYTKFIGIDGKIDKMGILTKKDRTDLEKKYDELDKKMKRFEKMMVANAIGKTIVSNEQKKKVEDAIKLILYQDG